MSRERWLWRKMHLNIWMYHISGLFELWRVSFYLLHLFISPAHFQLISWIMGFYIRAHLDIVFVDVPFFVFTRVFFHLNKIWWDFFLYWYHIERWHMYMDKITLCDCAYLDVYELVSVVSAYFKWFYISEQPVRWESISFGVKTLENVNEMQKNHCCLLLSDWLKHNEKEWLYFCVKFLAKQKA